VCWSTTAAHNFDSTHEVISPVFDNFEWGGVSCVVTYDALCQLLHVAHFFFTGWDVVFAIRGRWGDGGYGHADGFQHSRGVAGIGGGEFAHFSHDNHGFGNLESFRLTVELVWSVGRRGHGVIFRGRGAFPDAIS